MFEFSMVALCWTPAVFQVRATYTNRFQWFILGRRLFCS